jgi:hypothetical protein
MFQRNHTDGFARYGRERVATASDEAQQTARVIRFDAGSARRGPGAGSRARLLLARLTSAPEEATASLGSGCYIRTSHSAGRGSASLEERGSDR